MWTTDRDNLLMVSLLTSGDNLSKLAMQYNLTRSRVSQIVKQYFRRARRNDTDGSGSILWKYTFYLEDIYSHREIILEQLVAKDMLHIPESKEDPPTFPLLDLLDS